MLPLLPLICDLLWVIFCLGSTHISEFKYRVNMSYRSLGINSNQLLGVRTTYRRSATYMCHGCRQLYGSATGFSVILAGPEFRVRARGPQDPN